MFSSSRLTLVSSHLPSYIFLYYLLHPTSRHAPCQLLWVSITLSPLLSPLSSLPSPISSLLYNLRLYIPCHFYRGSIPLHPKRISHYLPILHISINRAYLYMNSSLLSSICYILPNTPSSRIISYTSSILVSPYTWKPLIFYIYNNTYY